MIRRLTFFSYSKMVWDILIVRWTETMYPLSVKFSSFQNFYIIYYVHNLIIIIYQVGVNMDVTSSGGCAALGLTLPSTADDLVKVQWRGQVRTNIIYHLNYLQIWEIHSNGRKYQAVHVFRILYIVYTIMRSMIQNCVPRIEPALTGSPIHCRIHCSTRVTLPPPTRQQPFPVSSVRPFRSASNSPRWCLWKLPTENRRIRPSWTTPGTCSLGGHPRRHRWRGAPASGQWCGCRWWCW